jgi:hypothetical protein
MASKVVEDMVMQLGGSRLVTMLGCKILFNEAELSVSLAQIKSRKCNYIKIMYDQGSDTYKMKFFLARNFNFNLLKEIEGIFPEQFEDLIKLYTGMETRI